MGKTLYVIGNGGSASTSSHAVVDFNKTVGVHGLPVLRTIAISEMVSLTTAVSNDIDFDFSFSHPLNSFLQGGDSVLVLSVSGTSPNLVNAMKVARERKCSVFAIFGEHGVVNSSLCDSLVIIPTSDYQVVENVTLFIIHWLTKYLSEAQ